MDKVLIKGGRVVTAVDDYIGDVLLEGGRIEAIGRSLDVVDAVVHDASGLLVMPGGIGTSLETFLIWQLLQVKHLRDRPLILGGQMWPPLIEWMNEYMLERGLVNSPDMEIAKLVASADEAMPIVEETYRRFKEGKK